MRTFDETQHFKAIWIWIILILCFLSVTVLPYRAGAFNNQKDAIPLILGGVIPMALVFLLFIIMKLTTKINENGIYYQFYPFHLKLKKIDWKDVKKCYLVKYRPIRDFGGYGIKYGFKKGTAYTMGGTYGLQIETNKNKKILIGTDKKNKMQDTLDWLFKHKLNDNFQIETDKNRKK